MNTYFYSFIYVDKNGNTNSYTLMSELHYSFADTIQFTIKNGHCCNFQHSFVNCSQHDEPRLYPYCAPWTDHKEGAPFYGIRGTVIKLPINEVRKFFFN